MRFTLDEPVLQVSPLSGRWQGILVGARGTRVGLGLVYLGPAEEGGWEG